MNNIFELEINKLAGMCINADLSDSEKGEIINNFMILFNLTQKQVADLLKIHSQKLNRWYISYTRLRELDDDVKELIKDAADRTKLLVLRLQEPNTKKKQLFFLKYKKGLATSQQERLISVLNGNMSIDNWEKQEDKKYRKLKLLIRTVKKEMLLI